jgi:hypothetical protein
MRLRSCWWPALLLGCATTSPAPKTPPPPAPTPVVDVAAETTVYAPLERSVRHHERERPPAQRKARQRVIGAKEYDQLARKFTHGFQPDDCLALCKADQALTRDGDWDWVLRCKLSRSLRDEPVIACREDSVEHANAND